MGCFELDATWCNSVVPDRNIEKVLKEILPEFFVVLLF
jgi:hypothetical protein